MSRFWYLSAESSSGKRQIQVNMVEISYNNVMRVTVSWDRLKRLPGHVQKAGELIYLKLFALEPLIALAFKLDPRDKNIQSHPRFETLSWTMFDMIDCAVGFLGPDLEPLSEDLIELGRRHKAYYLEPRYLDYMGMSIISMLKELLGSAAFEPADEEAWKVVYGFIAEKMVVGLKQA